ncbi:hypothetical protein JNX00_07895 [Hydrogenophaga sp. YM1]|uniref:hypothetical protein n=1 Tax=Hydrogenophaga sp. YM1 TaxID=2806262 RepID=UPI00195EA949|nr:hypothetical protein [Hydrogenophaga sp. YM1]QRR35774.1 hypothetical protein JNX00_07895 [Hydrogenophaga sp. YM1]
MTIISRLWGSPTMSPQKLGLFLRSVNIQQSNAQKAPDKHGEFHFVTAGGGVYVSSDSTASGISTRQFHKACTRLTKALNKHRDRLERQGLDVEAALQGLQQLKHTGKRFGPNDLAAFRGWRDESAHVAMHQTAIDIRAMAAHWTGWLVALRRDIPTGRGVPTANEASGAAAVQAEEAALLAARRQAQDFAAHGLPDERQPTEDDEDRTGLVNWLNTVLPSQPSLKGCRAQTLFQQLLVDKVQSLADCQAKLDQLLAQSDARDADPMYQTEVRLQATLLVKGIEAYLDGLIQAAHILSGQFRVNELPEKFHFLLVDSGKALADLFMAHLNASSAMMRGYRQANEALSVTRDLSAQGNGSAGPVPAGKPLNARGVWSFARPKGDKVPVSGKEPLSRARPVEMGGHRREGAGLADATLQAEQAAVRACVSCFGRDDEVPNDEKRPLMRKLQLELRGHPKTAYLDLRSLPLRLEKMPLYFGSRYRELEQRVLGCRQRQIDPASDPQVQRLVRQWQQGALDHIEQIETVAACLKKLASQKGVPQASASAMTDTALCLAQLVASYRDPMGPVMGLSRAAHAWLTPAQGPLGQVPAEIDDFLHLLEQQEPQAPEDRGAFDRALMGVDSLQGSLRDLMAPQHATPAVEEPPTPAVRQLARAARPAPEPSAHAIDEQVAALNADLVREQEADDHWALLTTRLEQQDNGEQRVQALEQEVNWYDLQLALEREDQPGQPAPGPGVHGELARRAGPADAGLDATPLPDAQLEREIEETQGRLKRLFNDFDGFAGAAGSPQRVLWQGLETGLAELGIDIDFMDLALAKVPSAIEQNADEIWSATQSQAHETTIVRLSEEGLARIEAYLGKLRTAAERMAAFAEGLSSAGAHEAFKALLGNTATALLELEALHRSPLSPLSLTRHGMHALGAQAQERLKACRTAGDAAKGIDLELDEETIEAAMQARRQYARTQRPGGKLLDKVKDLLGVGAGSPPPSDRRAMVPLAPGGRSGTVALFDGSRRTEVAGADAWNAVRAVELPKGGPLKVLKWALKAKKDPQPLGSTLRPPPPGMQAAHPRALPSTASGAWSPD